MYVWKGAVDSIIKHFHCRDAVGWSGSGSIYTWTAFIRTDYDDNKYKLHDGPEEKNLDDFWANNEPDIKGTDDCTVFDTAKAQFYDTECYSFRGVICQEVGRALFTHSYKWH